MTQDDVNDMNDSADELLNGDNLINEDDDDEATQSTRTANT